MMSKKMDSVEPRALLMADWRETANDIIKSYITDEKEIESIGSFVFDMIAVEATHPDAIKQAGDRATYLLAHSKKNNDSRSNASWWNVGRVVTQLLEKIDNKHNMDGELIEHFQQVPVLFPRPRPHPTPPSPLPPASLQPAPPPSRPQPTRHPHPLVAGVGGRKVDLRAAG